MSLNRLREETAEYAAFALLGLWERQLRLRWRERQLDHVLRNDQGREAIESAEIACKRAEVALFAGRTLDRSERALVRDLRASGATRLDLWILFSGPTIRMVRGELITGWRWIEWVIFFVVAVATTFMILPVSVLCTEAILRGHPLQLHSLSLFAIGISVHAWAWDLYLTEPLAALRQWEPIIARHRKAVP